MIRRFAGIVVRPRATLAELVHAPTWAASWSVILIVWAACGGWLLSTQVGQQALIDERVRLIEGFGGSISDAEYAALQARPPWWVYFTSGGRILLTPVAMVLAAAAVWVIARRDRTSASVQQALAIVVHASVVLVIGQLLATPVHYVRESLTSPVTVATILSVILPLIDEGTLPAMFLRAIDMFALWWVGLLALGLSVLARRPVGRYVWPLSALYVAFAAVVALIFAVLGGA